MKINREKLLELAALPDDLLWATIVATAKEHGHTLPAATPPHAELEKLRSLVRDSERIRIGDALRVLNSLKKQGKT